MLSIKKYAAIDIGSNAIRLLISNIIEELEITIKCEDFGFLIIFNRRKKLSNEYTY